MLRRTSPENVRARLSRINAGLPSEYVARTQVRRLRSQLILSISSL